MNKSIRPNHFTINPRNSHLRITFKNNLVTEHRDEEQYKSTALWMAKTSVALESWTPTVLHNYSEASGYVVNFDKSAICVIPSVSEEEGKRLASLVGMKLVDCHERYLRLPCFPGRNERILFADIVDRVWHKIKGWGEKMLSVGGKEILIKAVIQAIPSCTMSYFRMPRSLIEEVQRLTARFWWGGNEKNRKIHLGKWQRLCRPKSEGGLGFRDLGTFNRVLLAKQCWRIAKNPNSLATTVLRGSYFYNEDFLELDGNSIVDQLMSTTGDWDIEKLKQNFVQFDVDGILKSRLELVKWKIGGYGDITRMVCSQLKVGVGWAGIYVITMAKLALAKLRTGGGLCGK
ncbi:hypothetical protein Ddye_030295 [Dipteronia dyeriana]|uniref:Reverse transcriptase n=1 Tax=Dipteronia dyeriana TaxID=168575 RepID=A0AAD9TGQ2_9ROSI|nr:hypothetical protein Ddye_030295 [Dipteronia dyeriana]